MSRARRLMLPTLGGHLVREFAAAFLLALAAFVAIYLVVYFFDRVDTFLKRDVALGVLVRYFLFQIPLVVAQVTPFAVLMAALVGLGLVARQNEFVAMRACGVSVWQIGLPLVVLAAAISVANFAWGEIVVPYSARRWHTIDSVEIKKKGAAKIFTGRDVWFHGRAGFYNIERVSLKRRTLYGLTIYRLGPDFRPDRIILADRAEWSPAGWTLHGTRTRILAPDGARERAEAPSGFTLPETLEDFSAVSIEPEELSYSLLRRQIKDLRRKGVDTSESRVDLQLKLALPAANLVMMLLAVPLSTRGTRRSSVAFSLGLGVALGFLYYVVLAFSLGVGKWGSLPPVVAAWAANVLFALLAGYFFLGAD